MMAIRSQLASGAKRRLSRIDIVPSVRKSQGVVGRDKSE
jgi:hypothetical protein